MCLCVEGHSVPDRMVPQTDQAMDWSVARSYGRCFRVRVQKERKQTESLENWWVMCCAFARTVKECNLAAAAEFLGQAQHRLARDQDSCFPDS